MEISRKKITDSEIHAAEAELCAKVNGVMADFSEKFDTLGYELDAEFSRDNENLDDEEREALRATELTDACEYSFGYASGVKITVKRKKSEEENEKRTEENKKKQEEEEKKQAEAKATVNEDNGFYRDNELPH
jgi:preprotein translocase subunit SecF